MTRTLGYLSAFLFLLGFAMPETAVATPLNKWKISCSVDKGAITRKKNVWTFKTSANRCPGGSWAQRAEISTKHVSPKLKGSYIFTATVDMQTRSNTRFDVFQLHDGRRGCAPPLKVTIMPKGRIELWSDIKYGPGPEDCIYGKLGDGARSRGTFKRNGGSQKIDVQLDFDGTGGFDVNVWLDGAFQIGGRYDQPTRAGAFRSTRFYFKHGVYSQHMFDYVMTSRDMKVSKVRKK